MRQEVKKILVSRVAIDPSLGDDARRCRGVLLDLCANKFKPEINVLVAAISEGVVAEIRRGCGVGPTAPWSARLVRRMVDDGGAREDLSRWAVEAWGEAYGVSLGTVPPAISPPVAPSLPVSPVDHALADPFVEVSPENALRGKIREALADGVITIAERNDLQALRQSLGIDSATASRLFAEEKASLAGVANTILVPPSASKADLQMGPICIAELGLEMLPIPAGRFQMGSNDGFASETPHPVRISRPYWMGKTPVTQAQWQAIMGNNPSIFRGDNLPVVGVSWDDCVEFCRKLAERERAAGRLPGGYVYRLPTEAEWEYAARGGDRSKGYEYSGSNNLDEVGWYEYNSGDETHPVGQKKPNELGLYDMSGNVWEWCLDWYGEYGANEAVDPLGPATGSNRGNRGGSWFSPSQFCRSAKRDCYAPGNRISRLGFRVVLAPVRPRK